MPLHYIRSLHKYVWVLYCSGYVATVSAQANWLTVVGHQHEPQNDVVQVLVPLKLADESVQTLTVRVNRSGLRSSWDNVPYRSYTSTVVVDCEKKSGHYSEINFYLMPMWEGKPHNTSVFSFAQWRPMRFRDMTPNPTERIIKAACLNQGR